MDINKFAIFDQIKEVMDAKKVHKSSQKQDCQHTDIFTDNNIGMCRDCGLEITRDISFEKDWRHYGAFDTRSTKDPSRCNARKIEDKTIYKDVEHLGFGELIVSQANLIYQLTSNEQIHRGDLRKGIIFASIFIAYKESGNPQSCEKLIRIFDNMDRKIALKGLKEVNLKLSKNKSRKPVHISPVNLIDEIMDDFNATKIQKQEVFDLYEKVKNKSSVLNRSRPKSLSAGLLYYYCKKENKEIDIKDFVRKVGLSELTVNKISREIERIVSEDI